MHNNIVIHNYFVVHNFSCHIRCQCSGFSKERHYSTTWHWLKYCCVSVPVMLVSLLVSVLVALAYFWLCSYIEPVEKGYELSTITFFLVHQSPNVLYALVILVMNEVYTRIAYSLNDWGQYYNISV